MFHHFGKDLRREKILYYFIIQIWNKVRVRSDHKHQTVWMMVDDTDFSMTGRRIDNIDRVYFHLVHKTILGFKSFFLGITDGKSQFVLDFAILGEKGKKNNFSMGDKELESRFTKDRDESTLVMKRAEEYEQSKIQVMITMIKRAIRKGIRFDFLLANSWFTCTEVIRFICARHIKYHSPWTIKIGEKGVTKYGFEGEELTVKIMTGIFSIEEEEIFGAIINKSDNLAHFINFYELKSANYEITKLDFFILRTPDKNTLYF